MKKSHFLAACLLATLCFGCGQNEVGNVTPSLSNVDSGPSFRTVNATLKTAEERLLLVPEVDSLLVTGLDANGQVLFGPQIFPRSGELLSLLVPVATAKVLIVPRTTGASEFPLSPLSITIPAFSETTFDGLAQLDPSALLAPSNGNEITSLSVSPNPAKVSVQPLRQMAASSLAHPTESFTASALLECSFGAWTSEATCTRLQPSPKTAPFTLAPTMVVSTQSSKRGWQLDTLAFRRELEYPKWMLRAPLSMVRWDRS